MYTELDKNTKFNGSNEQIILKTWINICSLLNTIIAIVTALFVIAYVVIIYISKRNSKKSFHVSLILTCNTSLTIICSGVTSALMALACVAGDHQIVSLNGIISWLCHFRCFLTYIFITSFYLSYTLQAGYRFFRIVYHKHKYLRTMSTFSYYILAQWVLSFLLSFPILFGNVEYSSFIIYSAENFNCLLPFTNIRGVIFVTIIIYLFPLCGLCFIYSRIILHLREKRKSSTSTLKLRRQNKRDTSVIKRIYTVMIILWILSFPSILSFIQFLITGNLHWATYRICSMSVSISLVFISLSSLYVTPQIYKKLRVICGCIKPPKEHWRTSYSIHINLEKERKMESILLDNTTLSDSKMSHHFE